MNKETYIQTQIQSAFINKVLLENDTNNSFKILTSNFEVFSLSDIIDLYLSMPNNMTFLLYFYDVRDKLKAVLEMCMFKLNNIDDEYLIDEVYATQSDLIEMIKSLDIEIDAEERQEIEKSLLLSRGIDDLQAPNKKEPLEICYKNDYKTFLCLNGADKVQFNEKNYIFILMSIYYYFSQIVFTNDLDLTNMKLESILKYNGINEGKEFIDYYKKLIRRTFKESLKVDFDDFIAENLEEDESVKKERERNIKNCKIYDFATYKTKKLNKPKGE